jgi:ParB-like chromosome segregation protein Spo0J
MAARKLKIEDVPCIVATGWTDAQKRAYVLADNQLAANAGWDMDVLKVEIGEIQDIGFDIDLIGFSADELGRLMFNGDFAPGSLDEQGKLDELAPKIVNCPSCGESFDARLQEA